MYLITFNIPPKRKDFMMNSKFQSIILLGFLLVLCFFIPINHLHCSETAKFRNGTADQYEADYLLRHYHNNLLIIDLRPADDFSKAHIPNSISIPLPQFLSQIPLLPPNRPILLVCTPHSKNPNRAYYLIVENRPELLDNGLWYVIDPPIYDETGNFKFTPTPPLDPKDLITGSTPISKP